MKVSESKEVSKWKEDWVGTWLSREEGTCLVKSYVGGFLLLLD